MITLPASQTHIVLTQDEFDTLFPNLPLAAVDLREQMHALLHRLPTVARAVYARPNLHAPHTPLLTVVETVLYHFDQNNFELVAERLDMSYADLKLFLVGFVLGHVGR